MRPVNVKNVKTKIWENFGVRLIQRPKNFIYPLIFKKRFLSETLGDVHIFAKNERLTLNPFFVNEQ